MERLLRVKEVLKATGLSRSMLNYARKKGTFPTPVKLGYFAIAFKASEVSAWIDAREEAAW